MFEKIKNLFKKKDKFHFNANVKGFLLTKSDRINGRIDKLGRIVCKQNTTIDVKDFKKFVKSVEILIAQELTTKGIEKASPEPPRNRLA